MSLEQLLESVKAEPLSEQEVRALLDRVGQRELGGSDAPTIGAISEVTGTDPLELANMLQEIRSGEREEQFTAHVERLETKIDRLSETLRQRSTTEVRVVEVQKPTFISNEDALTPRLDPEIDPNTRLTMVWVGIVVFFVLGLLFVALTSHSMTTPSSGPPEPKCYNQQQEEIPCDLIGGAIRR